MRFNFKLNNMNKLINEIRKLREDTYKDFVKKYGARIEERIKFEFIEKKSTHWSFDVYDDKSQGTLEGYIYCDEAVNGGGFNNLIRYTREMGFNVTAMYGPTEFRNDADGFNITITL